MDSVKQTSETHINSQTWSFSFCAGLTLFSFLWTMCTVFEMFRVSYATWKETCFWNVIMGLAADRSVNVMSLIFYLLVCILLLLNDCSLLMLRSLPLYVQVLFFSASVCIVGFFCSTAAASLFVVLWAHKGTKWMESSVLTLLYEAFSVSIYSSGVCLFSSFTMFDTWGPSLFLPIMYRIGSL